MTFNLPLKYGWAAIPLFWGVSLIGFSFGLDVAALNLWCALLLLFLFNPTDIIDKKRIWYGCNLILIAILGNILSAKSYGVLCFAGACGLAYLFALPKKAQNVAALIIALGAFCNLSFITNTEISWVQYDFLSCYNYIEYILENHFMFWRENPLLTRPSYSTYHPILHYLLAASAVMLGKGLTENLVAANEALQVLLVGYMMWYYIFAHRILGLLRLSYAIRLVLLAFICLFPTYNAISGLINNDCLLLPLQAGAIYYALIYYLQGGRKNLLFIWGFIVLACLTKLSGILVLPMVGLALLLHFIKEKKLSTLYELAIFGVCLFLGVAIWPLYQSFILHIGTDFVPPQEHLALAPFSVGERFSPLRAFLYEKIFYDDYGPNLWETLTKTALFGQWNFYIRAQDIMPLLYVMIWGYKAINAVIIIAIGYLLVRQCNKQYFALGLVLTSSLLGGLLAFSLKHPYMCNQDFRYIAILPLGYAFLLSEFLQNISSFWRKFVCFLLIGFSTVSCLVWYWVSF